MLNPERKKELLFPHDAVRPIQDELILSVERALEKKKHLVVHAPTGLGKTAATLAPALSFALKNDLTVFFLTSRHTQHRIALSTVAEIERRYDITIPVANLIGKKWMCLQPGVDKMYSGEFMEYCRKLRDDKKCSYYENLKSNNSLSFDAKLAVEQALKTPDSRKLKIIGQERGVCPYEIGVLAAQKSRVIVTDYFYLFNPAIRDVFLSKIGKELESSIIIVDEAHNLPDRIKDLASERISLNVIDRAMQEAEKFEYELPVLSELRAALDHVSSVVDDDNEAYVERAAFLSRISSVDPERLLKIADVVREEQQRSYIGSVGSFLLAWGGDDEGFSRIVTKQDANAVLSYRCLDPGVVAGPVVRSSYNTIFMSGTLSPTVMYAELLDIPLNSEDYTFKSPFPDANRLSLIVPQTTTKYQARGDVMFLEQAKILAKGIDVVPGNSIVFFPSYYLRDKVGAHLQSLTKKTVFFEERGMGKQEREELLLRFDSYKNSGAVILGVMSGSFAEGVDFKGDMLKAVFVVGLPLARPDKETQALIKYYDEKFSRGWDYGYVFPAFNKILQSAGRAIRSERDRGALVFIDERYAWRTYQRCFPPDWDLRMSVEPEREIAQFFGVAVPESTQEKPDEQDWFSSADDF